MVGLTMDETFELGAQIIELPHCRLELESCVPALTIAIPRSLISTISCRFHESRQLFAKTGIVLYR